MRRALVTVWVGLFVAGCGVGPPPWGFDTVPEQGFRLNADSVTTVDGESVRLERYAEFTLRANPLDQRSTELALYLEKYYQSVDAVEGLNEVAISASGVVVREGDQEMRLGPKDRTPTSKNAADLLSRPISTAIVSSTGELTASPFHSHDPLLEDVHPLSWFLLATPEMSGGAAIAWNGSRQVPKIGQYQLGLQLAVRYELAVTEDETRHVLAAGFAQRSGMKLAEDFSGDLEVDFKGRTTLDADMRIVRSRIELEVSFVATDGTEIESVHEVRIQRAPDRINPEGEEPEEEEVEE